MRTSDGQPLKAAGDQTMDRGGTNQQLSDLKRERLRLTARYEEIMNKVVDGDDTGFTLQKVSQELKSIERAIARISNNP